MSIETLNKIFRDHGIKVSYEPTPLEIQTGETALEKLDYLEKKLGIEPPPPEIAMKITGAIGAENLVVIAEPDEATP
jgi:hypothetical protein